jgi:hypothetical protein
VVVERQRDRQPITPDSKRSAVIRLLLGIGVSVLGVLGLPAALATGEGVGYVLMGVGIIGLGIWTLFGGWRAYRQAPDAASLDQLFRP